MYLKKSEFDSLKALIGIMPSGEEFLNLPNDTQEIILNANLALYRAYKRNIESNKKSAKRMKEYRVSGNPKYLRGKALERYYKEQYLQHQIHNGNLGADI